MFHSIRGSASSGEEDGLSDSGDPRAHDEGVVDDTRDSCFSDTKKLELDAHDNKEVHKESSEYNHISDELEVGPGSNDPDSESLHSESSVINRIMENDAKCSLTDELENDISTEEETHQDTDNEAHAKMPRDDEQEDKQTPSLSHSQHVQCRGPLKECTETQCSQNSVGFLDKLSCQNKHIQNQVTISYPKRLLVKESSEDYKELKTKSNSDYKFYEPTKNESVLLFPKQMVAASATIPSKNFKAPNEEGTLLPVRQIMASPVGSPLGISKSSSVESMPPPIDPALGSLTALQPIGSKKIHIPRPVLSHHLGVCFVFMNRGICSRSECNFTHKVLSVFLFGILSAGFGT